MIDYELDFKVYMIEFSIVATLKVISTAGNIQEYQNSTHLNLEKLQCLPRS